MATSSCRMVLPEDELQSKQSALTRTRHNGEELSGHLEVMTDAPLTSELKIHFEGHSRSWRVEDTGQCQQILTGKYRFLCQIQSLQPIQFMEYMTPVANGRICYRIPFRFIIPHRLVALPHYANHEFTRLPPSLKQGETFRTWNHPDVYMQPLIVYTLRASIRRQNGVSALDAINNCRREVPIVPTRAAAPPQDPQDFPGEYRLGIKRKIRRHLWQSPLGTMSISSGEPAPWILSSTSGPHKTDVTVNLRFQSTQRLTADECPCRWRFTIKSSVESLTFCSTEPVFKEQPTIQAVSHSAALNVRADRSPVEKTEFSNRSLHLSRISCSGAGHDSSSSAWVAAIKIPIAAYKDLVPTFTGPLSARRYMIRLQLEISGMHHSAMNLSIPVQAVFDNLSTKRKDLQPLHDDAGLSDEDDFDRLYDSWAGLECTEEHATEPPPY